VQPTGLVEHSMSAQRLIDAVKANRVEAFRALLSNCDVDLNEHSLLHWAIIYRRVEMIDELVSSGCDVNVPGLFDGQFPLYTAVNTRAVDIARKLLDYGANPDLGVTERRSSYTTNDEPMQVTATPLLKAIDSDCIELVKMLLCAKADVNQADQDGYSPLVLAVEKGTTDVITLLLQNGADIECVGPTGRSVFDMASKESVQKALQSHLSRGNSAQPPASVTHPPSRRHRSGWRWFGGMFKANSSGNSGTIAVPSPSSVSAATTPPSDEVKGGGTTADREVPPTQMVTPSERSREAFPVEGSQARYIMPPRPSRAAILAAKNTAADATAAASAQPTARRHDPIASTTATVRTVWVPTAGPTYPLVVAQAEVPQLQGRGAAAIGKPGAHHSAPQAPPQGQQLQHQKLLNILTALRQRVTTLEDERHSMRELRRTVTEQGKQLAEQRAQIAELKQDLQRRMAEAAVVREEDMWDEVVGPVKGRI
jgi:hypothetical protein